MSAASTFASTLAALGRRIDETMTEALSPLISEAEALGSGDLARAALELARRGGKRLRGALVIAGHRAFGPEPAALLRAAAAIELFHAYLLVHDDIMDGDETRRGGPTLHVHFTAAYGDARLGEAMAILAGDLLSAWAHQLLATAGEPPRVALALAELSRVHARVVLGQKLDVAPRRASSSEELARAHDLKTGEYSFLLPLRLGAVLSGAEEARLAPFTTYSLHLGRAFQARDDLLGLYGAPEKLGKPVGADILAGRQSWLVSDALRAAPERAGELLALLDASAGGERVARAQALLEELGARRRCEVYIQAEIERAIAALAPAPLDPEAVAFLEALARFVGERES